MCQNVATVQNARGLHVPSKPHVDKFTEWHGIWHGIWVYWATTAWSLHMPGMFLGGLKVSTLIILTWNNESGSLVLMRLINQCCLNGMVVMSIFYMPILCAHAYCKSTQALQLRAFFGFIKWDSKSSTSSLHLRIAPMTFIALQAA